MGAGVHAGTAEVAGARADVGRLRSRFGVLRDDGEAGGSVAGMLFPKKY